MIFRACTRVVCLPRGNGCRSVTRFLNFAGFSPSDRMQKGGRTATRTEHRTLRNPTRKTRWNEGERHCEAKGRSDGWTGSSRGREIGIEKNKAGYTRAREACQTGAQKGIPLFYFSSVSPVTSPFNDEPDSCPRFMISAKLRT